MDYKNYKIGFIVRILILFVFLALLAYFINVMNPYGIGMSFIGSFIMTYYLYKFNIKRIVEIDDFFQAVKYRDFSRWYSEKHGSKDIQKLHQGFNQVNKTVNEINKEKETQYLYLQKILEVVQVGIIAYNIKSGSVLWINESIKNQLNIPSIKNISFLESRKKQVYEKLFVNTYFGPESISLELGNEKIQMLVSDSIFQVGSDTFKLVVLQNIEQTLNKNESEAWKKLLSVMTHEIMNSIAPISSLAETLKGNIQNSIDFPKEHPLVVEDLYEGIESVKKRSDGLMKFARTYRSLNKITHLNLHRIKVIDLFQSIKSLMLPSLESKGITIDFKTEPLELELEIDTYLIEQVLINLILNAVDACSEVSRPGIMVSAIGIKEGSSTIKISDNGKGIPVEIIDTVYVPFFSTKKNGSGIGLSLCKQIMILHQGKIQLQSIEGKGTTVNLVFNS